MDTRRLILSNKTINEWHEETRSQAHYFRNKYERCYYGKFYSIDMMQFYRRASDTYFEISEVLNHLIQYGQISDIRCLSCKFEPKHINKLRAAFDKFYPLIIKCRDGYHFKKKKSDAL